MLLVPIITSHVLEGGCEANMGPEVIKEAGSHIKS